ncbi:MAG TPA: hypothetical protein ENH85_11485 [Candidatus Scalindua sp.]|nr:hypothetical protein [Candidatus Scalindua sp.]
MPIPLTPQFNIDEIIDKLRKEYAPLNHNHSGSDTPRIEFGQIVLPAYGYIRAGQSAYNTGTGFYLGADDGTPRFSIGNSAGNYLIWDGANLSITGILTATSGAIGGWTIDATSIYTGTEDHTGYTANAGDITIYSNGTDSSIHAKNWYIDTAGNLTCAGATIGGSTISTPTITGIQSGSEIAIQGWTSTLVFTATAADTVNWSVGNDETITLLDGTVYTIVANDTGAMAALTYIYLDIATSITELQHSDTASDAVGTGKILVAIAEDNAAGSDATIQVFGGAGGMVIKAANIAADTITANEILANTITAAEITGTTLSGIFADLGTITAGNITIDASGYIKGGQTAYNTGTGFWLGYDTTAYKFSIGDANNYFKYDGNILNIRGLIQMGTFYFLGNFNDGLTEDITGSAVITRDLLMTELKTGATDDSIARLTSPEITTTLHSDELTFSGKQKFGVFLTSSITGIDTFAFAGILEGVNINITSVVDTIRHIGFYIYYDGADRIILATNANGTTQTTTQVSTANGYLSLRFERVGNNIKFYINDTLQATHTTNVPSGGGDSPHIEFAIGNNVGDDENLFISNNYQLVTF